MPAKKSSKKKSPKSRRPKAVPRILRPDERARLLKPATNYEEIAEESVGTWKDNRKVVKVVDLTPARLHSLLRRAKKAQGREAAAEEALQIAKDARLIAAHNTWKSLLDLKASVENAARQRPGLMAAFKKLVNAMKRGSPGNGGGTPPSAP